MRIAIVNDLKLACEALRRAIVAERTSPSGLDCHSAAPRQFRSPVATGPI